MNNSGSLTKIFEGVAFQVNYNNDEACALARFILYDLPPLQKHCEINIELDILCVGREPYYSLWDGEKKLYHGTSKYRLAYALINLILFHCIEPNDSYHALHSGAVFKGDQTILLPGVSGAGKSTLTGWLLTKGYHYLTDELVMLSGTGQVRAFTRPLSFKANGLLPFSSLLDTAIMGKEIIEDKEGAMVPHRLFNPDYQNVQPTLTRIIYPRFEKGAETTVEELSPARSCLQLLQSHVNGRNLDDLGVSSLSGVIRRCRSYRLTYGGFEGLEQVFSTLLRKNSNEK